MKKRICVLGGDLRQKTVYDMLRDDGYDVGEVAMSEDNYNLSALADCDVLILPVPAGCDNTYISTPLVKEKIKICDVAEAISRDCLVLGGMLSGEFKSVLEGYGIEYFDYFTREELIIKNAIPTAEGAIEIAMQELPVTLFGSRALVIGYGRIGKILADRLKAFGADVTVSARKHADFAWIEERALKAVHTSRIQECISDYDVIFNTVPATVLGENELLGVKNDAVIIDLASKPGGVDFSVAKEQGKNVIWALSLPGKTAPITAGKIIKDTILNILAEKGV